jgi:2,4-dienoyl-CoA reductase-like NADH-dependent reductase (Old Yellow Enzyme family)/thioredoxin reductase
VIGNRVRRGRSARRSARPSSGRQLLPSASLDHLFSPLTVGPVELSNRIVSTAHQTTLVRDHLPTEEFVAYHEARARGGAGLIVLEATAVHTSGLLTPHTLAGYRDEIRAGYEQVRRAVQPHGTKLFVQLFHGGREQIASAPRPPAVAPAAIPTQRFKVEPRALRAEEIHAIVAGYARAAGLAAKAGLDGIEISAAHGYLIAQFFTPELNGRADEWGEPGAFLNAVLAVVRETAAGIAIGVRLSADSPSARQIAGGLGEAVDYVHVALGDSSTYLGSVGIVPPPPTVENAIAEWTEPFRGASPLVATSRIVDPAEADRLIAEGRADAVGMTRALITDPDLPRKAREGRADLVVRCIACNACIAHYHAGTPIACAQNPRTGRELTLPRPVRTGRPLRLVVVGGGPAGVAAAVEAGEAGNEVVLLEGRNELGGQVPLAGAAPGHAELARAFQRNAGLLLDHAGVDVRLDERADREVVAGLEPDAVVVATGARPFEPSLRLEGVRVLQAWDVLEGPVPRGERVVVADWGGDPAGLDCAEVLDRAGNDVTVAVAAVTVAETMHQYQRNLYLGRVYRAGIRLEHHVELTGARPGAVEFRNLLAPELESELPADVLVLALGRVPEAGLADELEARGLVVERAGDVLSPRSIEEATLEGTLAARAVAQRVVEAVSAR